MTRLLERREFSSVYVDPGEVFEDLVLKRCQILNCILCGTTEPGARTVVRNVTVKDCQQKGSSVYGALFERVTIDGLQTQGLLDIHGAVFDRVVLRGRIGRVLISPRVSGATETVQSATDEWNRRHYEKVSYALDISEAECDELEVHGIPVELIRRDPKTQVVVTKQKARMEAWRALDLRGTWWPVALEMLAESRFESTVFVAPRRNRKFQLLLEGLKRLQEAGVAEMDP